MIIATIERYEPFGIGGVASFNLRFKEYLKRKGHTVYTLKFSKDKASDDKTFSIPYYFLEKWTTAMVPSEKALGLIKSTLETISPDLIYSCPGMTFPADFFFPSIAKEVGIPMVGTWHLDLNEKMSPIQVFAKASFLSYLAYCKELDLLHVFSERLKEFYVKRGVDPKKILVLPNGVDHKVYSPGKSEFGRKHNIEQGILFLGRLSYVKNPEVLIRSFLELEEFKTAKLVLVGDGELAKNLTKSFQDDRVIFTGSVYDEKKKIDIMRSCQVFALPSIYEGMPLAMLESMSVGLACVVTDVTTTKEVLSGCGITVSQHRLRYQLPLVLRLCLEYPSFAAELGKKAREKVLREFDQEKIFSRLVAAFEKVLVDYPGKKRKLGFGDRVLGGMGIGKA